MTEQPESVSDVPPHDPVLAPAPTPSTSISDPGENLGIVSVVLDVIGLGLIGIVLGIFSKKKSQKAGFTGTIGKIGIILGVVFTALTTIAFGALIAVMISVYNTNTFERVSPLPEYPVQQQT